MVVSSRPVISILLSARPSYAKLQPILVALWARRPYLLEVVVCASALLEQHGNVADRVREDFPDVPIVPLYSTLAGATLGTMAKDTGILLMALADHYARTHPALVVVMADRYETLAGTLAAAYQNIPVAHIQGGERSGNIDDRVRNANTVFATYHFPATRLAAERLTPLTRSGSVIEVVGCPSIDTALAVQGDPPVTIAEIGGAGADLDLNGPFLLLLQHSETDCPEAAHAQMTETLVACERAALPTLAIWPGADAGHDETSKALRMRAIHAPWYPLHTVRGIAPRRFLRLLRQCSVLVGNSSAGIREASALGTPVVNIGSRQHGRERAENVLDLNESLPTLPEAIASQRRHGPYPPSDLYGDGHAAERIAESLLEHV